MVRAIRAGLMSREMAVASLGYDLAEVDAQIAAGNAAADAAGIVRQRDGLLGRLQAEQARRASSQTQINRMTADGKTDEKRDQEYRTALLEFEACRIALEEMELQLAAYPTDPVLKLAGLETRKSALDTRIRELDRNEATESERLRGLAEQSPYSELATAEERLAELDAELSSERLRCASIAMLNKTYRAVKDEILAAVTKPVAEVATAILDRITGAPLGTVRLGSDFGIDGIERLDVEGPIEVVRLSGGEREQVYLATRLALAKVAAADERQLLVLDDVLTATDDERMRRICDVLEECAERLQIVILTCHPERFSGLVGARLAEMQRAAAAAV
jgi:DNA repair protein SbcC/Rad50